MCCKPPLQAAGVLKTQAQRRKHFGGSCQAEGTTHHQVMHCHVACSYRPALPTGAERTPRKLPEGPQKRSWKNIKENTWPIFLLSPMWNQWLPMDTFQTLIEGLGTTDSFPPLNSVSRGTLCSPPDRDSRSPGKGFCVGTHDPNYNSHTFYYIWENGMSRVLCLGQRRPCRDSLLFRFATISKLHHHDCNIVGAASVEGLQDDAFGPEVRFIQALLDESNCFFITESIPQTIWCQDHELRLQLVQVKGQDIWVWDDHIEIFQWIIPQGSRHGQDSLDPPGAIETDESTWKDKVSQPVSLLSQYLSYLVQSWCVYHKLVFYMWVGPQVVPHPPTPITFVTTKSTASCCRAWDGTSCSHPLALLILARILKVEYGWRESISSNNTLWQLSDWQNRDLRKSGKEMLRSKWTGRETSLKQVLSEVMLGCTDWLGSQAELGWRQITF